jgi:ABC-type arginine/histidine transport system permease subunit
MALSVTGGEGISRWAFMGAGCVCKAVTCALVQFGGEIILVFATTGIGVHCPFINLIQDGMVL